DNGRAARTTGIVGLTVSPGRSRLPGTFGAAATAAAYCTVSPANRRSAGRSQLPNFGEDGIAAVGWHWQLAASGTTARDPADARCSRGVPSGASAAGCRGPP